MVMEEDPLWLVMEDVRRAAERDDMTEVGSIVGRVFRAGTATPASLQPAERKLVDRALETIRGWEGPGTWARPLVLRLRESPTGGTPVGMAFDRDNYKTRMRVETLSPEALLAPTAPTKKPPDISGGKLRAFYLTSQRLLIYPLTSPTQPHAARLCIFAPDGVRTYLEPAK